MRSRSFFQITAAFLVLSLCSCGMVDERESNVTLPVDTVSTAYDGTDDKAASLPDNPDDPSGKVKFLAAGDNIIHECVYLDAQSAAKKSGKSGYDFSGIYENLADEISAADIAFVNQEGPICPDYAASGYPNFNAPKEAGQALVNAGFDIINIANNHMLDMDGNNRGGLKKTIDFWKTIDNTLLLGGYESQEDYNSLRYIEKNGIKIAMLSYTYGTNGSLSAASGSCVVPLISDSVILSQLKTAKANADFVIVYVHWGTESTISSKNMTYDEIVSAGYTTAFSPTEEQKRLAELMAENGADVVMGGHSHTLQPVNWIENDSGKTLVSYSLGNFASSQLTVQNLVGGMLEFDIVRQKDGTVCAENPVVIPTVCHYNTDSSKVDSLGLAVRNNIKLYRLSEYNEALAAAHGAGSYGSFTVSVLRDYVEKTIDKEFLEK